MESYLCINGKKTELTPEQLKALGLAPQPSLAEISRIIQSGEARLRFKIHDVLTLGGYDMEIIGFDHDKYESDERDETRAHTMTLMAKTLLPAHRIHSGACKRGWVDTEMRKWLNGEVFKKLPEELRRAIAPVLKSTHASDGTVYESIDRLFIPSESEYFGSAILSDYEDGPRYEAFATSELRVRLDEDGDPAWYWSRSFMSGGFSTGCALVGGYGRASLTSAFNTGIRAPLCFCLA